MENKPSSPLSRFVEPTIILTLITAVLYFWGYMYYAIFCETIGFSFGGIDLPFPSYLIVGWDRILYITMALCLLLCYWELVIWLLSKCFRWGLSMIFKKHHDFWKNLFESPRLSWIHCDDGPKNELLRFGFFVFIAISCAVWGMQALSDKAKKSALKIEEEKSPILIHNSSNEALEGKFFFIADFAGELVVGEQSEDRELTGVRIFKTGSYGSYTQVKKKATPPAPLPGTNVVPPSPQPKASGG